MAGAGIERLRQAGIDVQVGVLAAAAAQQNEPYLTRIRSGRPFIVWKCAATLDGRIAAASGDSAYVTGDAARHAVQLLRRRHPAISVGVGTVLADNPRLTVRLHDPDTAPHAAQPVRVIFDSHLRTPPDARLLAEPGRTLLLAVGAGAAPGSQAEARAAALSSRGAQVVWCDADDHGRVALRPALRKLAEAGLTSVLVEGGAVLAGALLAERLVDKLVWYAAPKLLGDGIPALSGLHSPQMADALTLARVSVRQIGDDICIEGYLESDQTGMT